MVDRGVEFAVGRDAIPGDALERVAAFACQRIVTVSEYHRRWAADLRITRAQKVVAIPNGIPLDRVQVDRGREAVRQELGIGADTRMLLSTGRLAESKGLAYLLHAAQLLRNELKVPFTLVCAGTGPHQADLEKLVRDLDLREVVTFLGFRNDIGDLLAASDIVVLPTLREGLSIALLEAMAAAKPIITTNIGSNVEATQNGRAALLVPARDAAALAKAIRHFANDAALRLSKSVNAKEIFDQHYTEDRMLESYRAQYLDLLQLERAPASAIARRVSASPRVYRSEGSL